MLISMSNSAQPHPKPGVTRQRLLLRPWRKHRGLTQEQLALRIDRTQGFISQLENGTTDWTGDLLSALAAALRCEPADLLVRNPLDKDAPWSLWDTLKGLRPQARKRAERVIKALADEDEEAAA